MSPIHKQLSKFSEKLKVPAVVGGVLTRGGKLDYDVVGTRRRGVDDPADLLDQWHIGSCAKSITSVLYARLVEKGDADWASPVATLFPDLKDEINKGWANRSIEDLFLCRAGMKANPSLSALFSGWSDTRPLVDQRTEAAIAAMRKAPKKRKQFLYSNLSYIIIGAAIDRLSGVPYEKALERLVQEPLGITSLGYGPPPKVWGHRARVRLGNLALFMGKPAHPDSARSDNPRVFSSAGTMHMTLPDWAKFLHLFVADGGDLLKPQSVDYLLQAPDARGTGMVKGWAIAESLKGVSFGMQGSNTMWAAAVLLNESRTGLSLVVCNDGRSRVVSQSARLALQLLNST